MISHPLEALSEQYLEAKHLSPATLKAYRIAFKHFTRYLKRQDIAYATTRDVIGYREEKRMVGHSAHYIYIHISALKGLYRYLSRNHKRLGLPDAYAHDIMAPVKNEKIAHRIKKPILTVHQARQLLLGTKEMRKYIWHYRDHAIIYLMLTSGLSAHDIINAKRKDTQRVNGKVLLYIKPQRGKKKDAFVKLSAGAKAALDDYLCKRNDPHPYLFISHGKRASDGQLSRTFFQTMFPRVLKHCGLEKLNITPHCLRHTAATLNLLRGASIEQTKSLMRHADIQSTLVYQEYIARLKDDSAEQVEAFILKEDDALYNAFPALKAAAAARKRSF